ncbi:FAD binding domain-containing protein [Diaporthe helianthi]|uniref:FAD binding domain-containing protein n=1 Tax=Diaporthe helianthi TaxID=158607 RepID=A0A2P5HRL3_DIAHE|nr:FAD binding domain-containing protein [Diaporthe helianthi]
MAITKQYDIIIVGAGPVGLFLASELALEATTNNNNNDMSVLVLERDPLEPTAEKLAWTTAPLGVRGLNTASAETLHRRGLLDLVFEHGVVEKLVMSVGEMQEKTKGRFVFGGHFAGMLLDANKIDTNSACFKYKLPGPASMGGPTTLDRLTRVLRQRVEGIKGVELLGNVDIATVSEEDYHGDDSQGVVVGTSDGQEFHARFVVGCDGGRSAIRKAAGFDFVGTDAELMGYSALCEFDDPQGRIKAGFWRTKGGIYVSGGQAGDKAGQTHFICMDADATATATNCSFDRSKPPVTREHLEAVARRVVGHDDLGVKTIHQASSWTDRSRQATTYRRGRVLLAGDSAHIHSPLGAQGLNTGIGDAVNLGWKLGRVVRGHAPVGFLDTYTRERHPVGADVLEWSRAQVATLCPDPSSRALAGLVQDLVRTSDGTTCFVDRIWGLSQRYDMGDGGDGLDNQHPMVGFSAPDFEFVDDGTGRLGELMRSGHGLLVDLGHDDIHGPELSSLARDKAWFPQVDYVGARAKDDLGIRALLVRPDGVVAWAAGKNGVGLDEAKVALSRWFGTGN